MVTVNNSSNKKINPIWFLVLGIAILIIPTGIYLGILIPKLKEEYIILMSSGGCIGGAGMLGTSFISEKTKYGALYKTASKSFTALVVVTLIKDFVGQLLGLGLVFVVSYIIFIFLKGLYRDGKQARQNKQLAEEVARSLTEAIK